MFQNSFQSGSHVEIFDAKISKDKDKLYEKLYKIINSAEVNKVYDKRIKSYIYELDRSTNTKIQFPKEDKQELGLTQHYLVLQIFIPIGSPFSIEIVITDTAKNKRRLNFTSSINKIDKNFFHAKIPIDIIKRGSWLNLSIDLLSFFELFKGQTFRSIDTIIISAVCKLKKIFTMKNQIIDGPSDTECNTPIANQNNMQQVPKTQNYPSGIQYVNQLLTYDCIMKYYGEEINEIPEHIYSDEASTSSNTKLGDSLKGKNTTLGNKELRGNLSRTGGNGCNGIEIKSRADSVHNTICTEPEKKIIKANKENLESNSKGIISQKNPQRFTTDSSNTQESIQGRAQSSIKKDIEQRSPSPFRYREEKSVFVFPKFKSESSEIEESKEEPNTTIKISKDKVGRSVSQDVSLKKPNSTVSQKKSPNLLEANQKDLERNQIQSQNTANKGTRNDKKNGVGNHWLEISENTMTLKKKTSRSNLLSNTPNNFKTPINKDTKFKGNEYQTISFDKNSDKLTVNKVPQDSKDSIKSTFGSGKSPGRYSFNNNNNNSWRPKTKASYLVKKPPRSLLDNEIDMKLETLNKSTRINTTITNKTQNESQQITSLYDINQKSFSTSEKYERIQKEWVTDNNDDIESIEENLEYDMNETSSVNFSKKLEKNIEKKLAKEQQLNANNNIKITKRSISEINNLMQEYNSAPQSKRFNKENVDKFHVRKGTIDDFTNSVESDNLENKISSNIKGNHQRYNTIALTGGNTLGDLDIQKDGEARKRSLYEDQIDKMLNNTRPFTPPFSRGFTIKSKNAALSKNNESNMNTLNEDRNFSFINHQSKKEDNPLEVIYDPSLNCYYNPNTNSYYELKQ